MKSLRWELSEREAEILVRKKGKRKKGVVPYTFTNLNFSVSTLLSFFLPVP